MNDRSLKALGRPTFGRDGTSGSAAGIFTGNAWADARIRAVQQAVPGIKGLSYEYIKPSNLQPSTNGATPTVDANADATMVGGGRTPNGGVYMTFSGVIYTDLITQRYVWATRGKFAVPSAGLQLLGPTNTAEDNYAMLFTNTGVGGDATRLVLQLWKTGAVNPGQTFPTSHVIDGNTHNYTIAYVPLTGTLYVLVDDAIVLQVIVIPYLSTANVVFAAFNTTFRSLVVDDWLYGYDIPLLPPTQNFAIRPGQKIVFDGDSITAGFPAVANRWQAPFEASLTANFLGGGSKAGPVYANVAVGGNTTADCLAGVGNVTAQNPDHVFVMVGINDFFNHGGVAIPPATSATTMGSYFAAIKAARPNVWIHFLDGLFSGGENWPLGANVNDAAITATLNAIDGVVAVTSRVERFDIRTPIFGQDEPRLNPGHAANGVLTQADGTHPSANGQLIYSWRVSNLTKIGV